MVKSFDLIYAYTFPFLYYFDILHQNSRNGMLHIVCSILYVPSETRQRSKKFLTPKSISLAQILKMLRIMLLFFIIPSCIFPRKISRGRNLETTTWPSTTKLPPTTTFRSETAETILFPTSQMSTSSYPIEFLTPRIIYLKPTRKSFTTHTYPRDPSENFQFISARNESDLDEIIAVKCEKGGEMDVYYGELENQCIFTIYCCGPNIHPKKNIYFIPKSYGLK